MTLTKAQLLAMIRDQERVILDLRSKMTILTATLKQARSRARRKKVRG